MLKKLILSCLILCPALMYGQADNVVIRSDYGKCTILKSIQFGTVDYLSADAKYISGSIADAAGFIYDIEQDTSRIYNGYVIKGIVSPEHFVAQTPQRGTPIIYRNGNITELERPMDPAVDGAEFSQVSIYNMSGNGDKIAVMTFQKVIEGESKSYINLAAVYDGHTGKLEKWLWPLWDMVKPLKDELNTGYGSRPDFMSADGNIVGGWGSATVPDIFSNWTMTFWDISSDDTIKTFALDPHEFCMGNINGGTADGHMMVGGDNMFSLGVIIYYDKENGTYSLDSISPLLGYTTLDFTDVSEDSVIIGYQEISGPDDRNAVIYTKSTGLLPLKEFLSELYDIHTTEELFVPTKISDDGKIIIGSVPLLGDWYPWIIQLGDTQIHPKVRKPRALAATDALVVKINWVSPVGSMYTLKGFNIYREDSVTKINTQLIAPDATSYTDNTLEAGRHRYLIEAVYEDGTAKKVGTNEVLALASGSCYPVQEMNARLTYNKFISLYWGLPSSEILTENNITNIAKQDGIVGIKDVSGVEKPSLTVENKTKNSYKNANLDYIYNADMKAYDGYAGIKIGDNYYVSSHRGSGIRVLDANNMLVKEINPSGLGTVFSMVKIGNMLYCGGLGTITIIDLEDTESIANRFEVKHKNVRHLAYVSTLDDNKGALVLGDWDANSVYSMDGDLIGDAGFDFSELAVSGAAYHDGKYYVFSQSGKYLCEIYVFDFETKKLIDGPIQVAKDPGLYNLLSLNGELSIDEDEVCVAGGLTINTLEDGTVALGAGLQCAYITCRLAFLEISGPTKAAGYDLYRNGEKINTEPLTSRRYNDEINEKGTYVYNVKYRTTDNCTADASPDDTVKITDQGTCFAPIDIKAMESNNSVILSWGINKEAKELVGFNVYRDGNLLKQLWEKEIALQYIDEKVELGEHKYRVEAFHIAACAASDSTTITVTGEGKTMPPYALKADYKVNATDFTKADVSANWETPMFEEPLPIRYGSGLWGASLTVQDWDGYYAAIGWDSTALLVYKDLYLVGMEYLVGNDVSLFEGIVYVDDKLVYSKDAGRIRAGEWNTLYFDKSFSMNQRKEVAVGYHVTFPVGTEGVMAIDPSFVKTGYSDLLSNDGIAYTSLTAAKAPSSWCIAGLVVRKRDLDKASQNGTIDYSKLEGKIMRMSSEAIEGVTKTENVNKVASTKAPFNLKGFDVYRAKDGSAEEKLNKELLTTFSFADEKVEQGEYTYKVNAVYGDQETASASIFIEIDLTSDEDVANKLNINLYPNPTSELVNITGEYKSLKIVDLNGNVISNIQTPTSSVNVSNFAAGSYFFKFTTEDESSATYKVVVR